MCLIFYPFLILICFFTFPFPMIFNCYIIKKITFQKLFVTHQFGERCSKGMPGIFQHDKRASFLLFRDAKRHWMARLTDFENVYQRGYSSNRYAAPSTICCYYYHHHNYYYSFSFTNGFD
jgi:hypothetical protein